MKIRMGVCAILCILAGGIVTYTAFYFVRKINSYYPRNPKRPLGIFRTRLFSGERAQIFDIPSDAYAKGPAYFSITNTSKAACNPYIVINGKDWSSDKAILQTIFKDTPPQTIEYKVISIMEYISRNNSHGHVLMPDDSGYLYPVSFFNLFGYGVCSDFAFVMATLAEKIGLTSRIVDMRDHSVAEVFYDNAWHMFDADGGCYYRKRSGEIADVESIMNDPSIVGTPNRCRVAQFAERQIPSYITVHDRVSQLNIKKPVPEPLSATLQPGEELRYYYNWQYAHTTYRGAEPPDYTNGVHTSLVQLAKDSSKTIHLPYPIVGARILAKGLCSLRQRFDVIIGKNGSRRGVVGDCRNNILTITVMFASMPPEQFIDTYELIFSEQFRNALLSHTPELTVETIYQVAQNSLPVFVNGRNKIINASVACAQSGLEVAVGLDYYK